MRILRLHATNYCQHRNLEVFFEGRTVGILGKNHNGKTNLIRAIQDAVTGKFWKAKDKTITYGETEGAVEVDFVGVDRIPLRVRRELHTNAATLHRISDGELMAKTADSVAIELRRQIPVDPAVMRHVVFAPQEEVLDLLFRGEATRKKLAMSFFGVERAKVLDETLAKLISDMPVSVDDALPAEIDGLRARIQSREGELSNLRSSLLEMSSLRITPQRRQEIQDAMSAARLESELTIQAAAAADSLRQVQERLQNLQNARDEEQSIIAGFDSAEIQDRIDRSRRQAEYNRRKGELTQIAMGRGQLTSLGGDCSAALTKVEDLEKARSELLPLMGELRQRVQIREEFCSMSSQSTMECPCCLSTLTEDVRPRIEASIPELRSEAGRMAGNAVELDRMIGSAKRELESLQSQYRRLESSVVAAEEELESMIDPERSPEDVTKLEEAAQMILEVSREIAGLDAQIRPLVAQEIAWKEQLSGLESRLASVVSPGSDLGSMSEILEADSSAEVAMSGAQQQILGLETLIATDRQTCEMLTGKLLANRKSARNRDFIQRVRARFHYGAAPQRVVQSRLMSIQGRVNYYLEMLGTEYRVRVLEGLNFVCTFPGKEMDTSDLSGGEKMDLSIAFRLAASESFCSDVGFLVLDEPTTWLDSDTVERMVGVLDRLHQLGEENDSQFLIPTHERALIEHFDQVIEI